jgi:hypothetical protein
VVHRSEGACEAIWSVEVELEPTRGSRVVSWERVVGRNDGWHSGRGQKTHAAGAAGKAWGQALGA